MTSKSVTQFSNSGIQDLFFFFSISGIMWTEKMKNSGSPLRNLKKTYGSCYPEESYRIFVLKSCKKFTGKHLRLHRWFFLVNFATFFGSAFVQNTLQLFLQLTEVTTRGVLYKEAVFEYFAIFTGKNLSFSLFLVKLQVSILKNICN